MSDRPFRAYPQLRAEDTPYILVCRLCGDADGNIRREHLHDCAGVHLAVFHREMVIR